jgi:hypothetical protein
LSGKVRFAARVVGKDVEDGEVVPVNLQRRPEQCLGFSFCDDGPAAVSKAANSGAFTRSSFERDVRCGRCRGEINRFAFYRQDIGVVDIRDNTIVPSSVDQRVGVLFKAAATAPEK